MVNLSPAYKPVLLKGVTIHKDNPFLFDFIIDPGQDRLRGETLKKEGEKLVKYFLASLAIPEKDLWVNLSPFEKDRTLPQALSRTDMGRDLLAQDYILKQITASLIYPEKELGRMFWNQVYLKAQQLYGTTEIPVNTFNKVWIMPQSAEVNQYGNTAVIAGGHLKVMLEEDYLATTRNGRPAAGLYKQIIKEVILPELEREVNEGKNFTSLRQVFNSLILANWYKTAIKESLLNRLYSDQKKIGGIDLKDPRVKEQIYRRYLTAYKKGVFNYIKEDSAAGGRAQPRKYFSGGVGFEELHVKINVMSQPRDHAMSISEAVEIMRVGFYDPSDPGGRMEGMRKRHYVRTVLHYSSPQRRLRRSEIFRLNPVKAKRLIAKLLEKGSAMPAVILRESVINRSREDDVEIILNPAMGIITEAYMGKTVTLGRNAAEILEGYSSDEFSKILKKAAKAKFIKGVFKNAAHAGLFQQAVAGSFADFSPGIHAVDPIAWLNAFLETDFYAKALELAGQRPLAQEFPGLKTYETKSKKEKKRAKRRILESLFPQLSPPAKAYINVKFGGFFRVKIWLPQHNEYGYLLFFNYDKRNEGFLKLTPPGGGFKFIDKGPYSDIEMTPNLEDASAIDQRVALKDLPDFLKRLDNLIGRNGFPLEEFLEEFYLETPVFKRLPKSLKKFHHGRFKRVKEPGAVNGGIDLDTGDTQFVVNKSPQSFEFGFGPPAVLTELPSVSAGLVPVILDIKQVSRLEL